jgi:hypothetical protein
MREVYRGGSPARSSSWMSAVAAVAAFDAGAGVFEIGAALGDELSAAFATTLTRDAATNRSSEVSLEGEFIRSKECPAISRGIAALVDPR